jgi:hypothetical protein
LLALSAPPQVPPSPPTLCLLPPNSGLPFDPQLEAAKAPESVRLRLPNLPPPRTPDMHLPTPKAFWPAMPDKLGRWSSFLINLAARHSFEEICGATRGRHELTPLPPGTHPAATLINQLQTGDAPMLFAADTPVQDLAAALAYGCYRSAIHAANFVHTEFAWAHLPPPLEPSLTPPRPEA